METKQLVDETIEKYEKYLNPSIARLFRFMGLGTIEWKANGSVVSDVNGQEYIDCLGGYGTFSLGHRHPKVVEAVKKQLDLMPLSSKIFLDKPMADLAELLAQITPGDLTYSFIVNSGAEAVEGALKIAMLHTGRKKIISTYNSFHGKTLGALSATGRKIFREPFEPLMSNFIFVPYGDASKIAETIDENTAAVIVEPIQGEGGIIIPPDSYFSEIRKICDEAGALLIADEVQTGLGRTGKMFAVEHYNVVPDMITTAKALGGGVMPIGAFTACPKVWDKFIESPLVHTTTFGGNPLACAAAIASIKAIIEEKLPDKAKILGEYFITKLNIIKASYPRVIAEVRGKGLMIGLELSKEGIGGYLMSELINHGVLAAYTLNNPKVIRIEPPLIITKEQIDYVLNVMSEAVANADEMVDEL